MKQSQNDKRQQFQGPRRVLVALDASPQSLAALEAATDLAEILRAELSGIFVHDVDLERLCSLPFSKEIGAYSATSRALSEFCMNREFYALEKGIRRELETAAAKARVPWSLHIAHGGVQNELLKAAREAAVLSLGRSGWSRYRHFGSTTQFVLRQREKPVLLPGRVTRTRRRAGQQVIKVVDTGTSAAVRAVALATQLAEQSNSLLLIYQVLGEGSATAVTSSPSRRVQTITISQPDLSKILYAIHESQPGIMILANTEDDIIESLVDHVSDPVLLMS